MVSISMFIRLVALFAGVATLAAGLNASAQKADETAQDEIIMSAWSNPTDCNQAVARPVSFSVLAADAEGLIGECVKVEGYWSGRALFGSSSDARFRLSNTTDRLRGERIGIYAQWDSIGEPPDRPKRTLFVGRVGQCETQWPGAIMVMGYCHYTGGSILLVAEAFPR
ncbi:hypothetical protein GCM10023208_07410 [Erythrobacter westpacificensis]|uniref:DUF3757 domain-containing protein n=1 Tax=Erythrobacter westpacificensis TaxID=1055231 RepID=A0ABP9K4F9_9SPHN